MIVNGVDNGTCLNTPGEQWCGTDGVFIKQMHFPKAGMVAPQHSHKYSHMSMIAAGSVRVWANDKLLGDFKAPLPLLISEGVQHKFVSLEDNTIVYCIHNTDRTNGVVEVEELNYHKEAV